MTKSFEISFKQSDINVSIERRNNTGTSEVIINLSDVCGNIWMPLDDLLSIASQADALVLSIDHITGGVS
jgi:hypothetical protein